MLFSNPLLAYLSFYRSHLFSIRFQSSESASPTSPSLLHIFLSLLFSRRREDFILASYFHDFIDFCIYHCPVLLEMGHGL
jgi:hypothetical protein